MNRFQVIAIVVSFFAYQSNCEETSYSKENSLQLPDDQTLDSRLLVITNTTSVTIGFASFILSIAGVIALIALIAGLIFLLSVGEDPYGHSGYGSSYDGGYSSGSSYARKVSFNPYAIDWEKFSIIDWISIGEETWRKFNPSDLECQKRLICEIHQNTEKFGYAARRIIDLFSYLQYAEVLNLPEEVKALVEEYMDAADRGRTMKKDCGEIFNTCEFSVKSIFDRYGHNEV